MDHQRAYEDCSDRLDNARRLVEALSTLTQEYQNLCQEHDLEADRNILRGWDEVHRLRNYRW